MTPAAAGMPGAARILFRGVTRRCPRCGRGGLRAGWFSMVERCPRCGLRIERDEGAMLGSMAINLGVTELTFGVFLVVWLVLDWPDVRLAPLLIAGVTLNAVLPVVLYPFSKTTWAAIDLLMHRLDPEDRRDAWMSEVDAPPGDDGVTGSGDDA